MTVGPAGSTPTFSETYRFYANTDDGARLWVNNVKLVDNWTDHGPTETSGTITLTAGVTDHPGRRPHTRTRTGDTTGRLTG